ncbi:unnamed protein product [marine sediment metagenome]|uniref:Nudix hydrolase domain-containing protein n=1 Tax=marine sediment metagenome TaxID=412755 RepID=X1QYL9_9ZZZZ
MMEPIVNRKGDILLEFIHLANEEAIEPRTHSPLVASLVVAEHEGKVLLVFNRKRQNWELPSGRIEADESPRDCAIRELFEESGQSVNSLDFVGLAKIRVSNGNITFLAIYSACLVIISAFQANEEISMNTYWDFRSNIGYINEIDLSLVALVINH